MKAHTGAPVDLAMSHRCSAFQLLTGTIPDLWTIFALRSPGHFWRSALPLTPNSLRWTQNALHQTTRPGLRFVSTCRPQSDCVPGPTTPDCAIRSGSSNRPSPPVRSTPVDASNRPVLSCERIRAPAPTAANESRAAEEWTGGRGDGRGEW